MTVPPPAAGTGTTRAPATLRSLVVPVYAPAVVFGIGQGAALPVVALSATELGASTTVAAFVAASTGAGLLVGDLPAGRIVARYGERVAIVGGSVAGALGVLLALLAPTVWLLAAGVLVSGCAMSVWTLARQRYLADAVPVVIRARAMSVFATMWRVGALVGPFVGAAVISRTGTRGGFAVQLVAILVSGWLMSRLPTTVRAASGALPSAASREGDARRSWASPSRTVGCSCPSGSGRSCWARRAPHVTSSCRCGASTSGSTRHRSP